MNDRVSITVARENLAELVGRVQYSGERIILEKRGKPAVALVSAADVEWLEAMEAAQLSKAGEAAYQEYLKDPSKTIGHDALWADIMANLDKA